MASDSTTTQSIDELSVANMYLVRYGSFVKYFADSSFWTAAGIAQTDFPTLTVVRLFASVVPVAIGNIIGGVLVGAAYWFAYLRADD